MQWREDVGPTRAGDRDARERLKDYFTPFAHGVALAHAPHHVVERLVPKIFEAAFKSLGGVDDAAVGTHVMNVARRLAKEANPGPRIDEAGGAAAGVMEARHAVSRLRTIAEGPREKLVLRLVEGIPGPELAEVLRVSPAELRAELERGAGEAARVFGQGQSFAGDEYLWELTGAPPALLARLEMQLPALRFDPSAPAEVESSAAGTFQELPAVGSLGGAMKPLMFEEFEGTETGVATTPAAQKPPPPVPSAPSLPNPFEAQPRTIAATDLPAEARANLPPPVTAEQPASSKSGRQGPLPARPIPAPGDGERSGKSASGKKEGSKSARMSQLPPREVSEPKMIDVTREGPKLVEPDVTAPRAPALGEVVSGEGILGKPTMVMPLGSAVAAPERAPGILTQETRIEPITAQAPKVGLLDSPTFKGTQPLFVAGFLVAIALVAYSTSMYAVDRNARASWPLAQVVVAAEDMVVGQPITMENVALRAVPETFQGEGVVRGDKMDFILDQKLAVTVQMGDPIFYKHLASVRLAEERLALKVNKRARAVSLGTNVIQAVGRWVKPGDLVDVIVSLEPEKKGAPRRAVTLFQKVQVIATGKISNELSEATADDREKQYVHVTLLLTPEEVEGITLASRVGKVKLTLRNEEDFDDDDRGLDRAFSDANTLLNGEQHRLRSLKRARTIQILRGAPAENVKEKAPR
jgi:Flp pilus assembly protein CpaB